MADTQGWPWPIVAVTAAGFAVAILAAPSADTSPARGLGWLLFVGSSVHVASTGWLFSFGAVRRYAGTHRFRYVVAPITLIAFGAAIAAMLSTRHLAILLLGYFGWQLHHYQKQNLGLAALAACSLRVSSLTLTERRAMIATGLAGVEALLLRPGILQLPLSPLGGWSAQALSGLVTAGFVSCAAIGIIAMVRRPAADRPGSYCAVYLTGLLFPMPIFVFSSPYAAIGGMTIAHGLQYLVLISHVAAGPPAPRSRVPGLTSCLLVSLVAGSVLNLASHLHSGGLLGRVVYGGYLGVVMAHFVVDAGIWRLRDPFPRQFLSTRLPEIVRPIGAPVSGASATGVR